MTLFLFLKQIVDIFYQYKSLDYLMVIFALFLLVYQFMLVRPDIRKRLTLSDGMIVVIALHVTMIFFRNITNYGVYFKTMSAFLMFFIGRIYYDRIKESTGALVYAAYIVVYGNLVWRFIHFGINLFKINNAYGDLYYQDTDMAFAMILAMTFIIMYGHNTLFKYITSFVVCPLMVFTSDAGIQMTLMIAVLCVIFMYILELLVEKPRVANILLTLVIVGLLALVVVIYLPVFDILPDRMVVNLFGGRFLDNDNMYGRYEVWKSIVRDFKGQDLNSQIFGISLVDNENFGSLYIKLLYSLGYFGILMALMLIANLIFYIIRVNDRKTFYMCVMLAVMLFGTGVTVCSMDFTQMSWFPMMFAGMVVSSVQVERDEKE